MVGGRHDGEGHRDRHGDGKRSNRDVRRHLKQDDADEEIPAGVQTRKGRVLVGERGRLHSPVAVGVLRHGVDEAGIHEPRWRDGNGREEEEADQAGDEHGVSQQPVLRPMPDVEKDPAGHDHRPVTVDIDPVGDGDKEAVVDNQPLRPALPRDPQRPLKPEQCIGVRKRAVHLTLG